MQLNCPICRKLTDSERDPDFPFCSARCRLLDLGNWADERYRVPDSTSVRAPDTDDERPSRS
ncbi:MAG TPA: DNA gyrase inhibitor YacG [Candidatus Xenobia bacterium]|nr:DNA gyrase inhibitor YacG [Candidatus Xenobia bacterium]